MTLAAWTHTLDPFLFRLPGSETIGVRWYGLAYIAAFVLGWLVMRLLAKRGKLLLDAQSVDDLALALIIGVVIGGRLGYAVFYRPSVLWTFTAAPPWWELLAINRGGMASHGGVIGVIAACVWFGRRRGVSPLHLLDVVALLAPIGMLLGRLANFVNGELLGRVVAGPGEPAPWWAVRYPQELLDRPPELSAEKQAALHRLLASLRPPEGLPFDEWYASAAQEAIRAAQRGDEKVIRELSAVLAARHPSQLYQAAAEGVVLGALLWWIWRRPRKPGVVGAWFMIVYGSLRIVTEFWRLPDAHLAVPRFLGLSRGQWLSAAMVAIGLVALRIVTKHDAAKVGGWRRRL